MMKRLQEIFNIHPGEERMVGIVLIYAIMLFASNVLAITASLALFFETYDAATLPYTYVLLMVVGPLISLIYLRLNNHFPLSKALLSMHAFLLLTLILLPLLLNWSSAPILRFSLPVYLEMNITLTYATFWNLLGRIYNLRQGKRLFPLLSSGENIATIGAGFLTTLFVARFNTVNLYWISALFMTGAVALLIVINRTNSEKMSVFSIDDVEQARPSGLKVLIREPYVRLLFVVVTLYTISIVMVDTLSFAQAEIRFPTANGMATYVGLFMAVFGVLGLLVQWFVAGRALDRFGVIANIFALPVGLFAIMFIFALLGSIDGAASALFWLAAGANMYAYTLDAPYIAARNIVLQPLPAQLRTQAQTTVMGIAYPLATGLSGLLLLFLLNVLSFDSVQISYAILIVLLLWLFSVARLGRAYTRRLREVLQSRSLGGVNLFRSPDRTSISVLEETLRAPHAAAVLYALDMLAKVAPEVLPDRLPDLLDHPHDKVRISALEYMAELTWNETPVAVGALLDNSPNPVVRAAALRSWYSIEPQAVNEQLLDYSHDPAPPVRQTALAIMCLHADRAFRQQAAEALDDLVASANPADRLLAAYVISEAGSAGDNDHFLRRLLTDSSTDVKRAALAAAAQTRFPTIWTAVIPLLGANKSAALAADALVAGGEPVLPLLQAAAAEPEQDPRILSGIAQVCGRTAGPEAVAILEPLLDHATYEVRHQALFGLSRCDYQAAPVEREAVQERFRAQVRELVGIVNAQVDVGKAQEVHLTADALEQQRQMRTDDLLLLISFLNEPQMVLSAREALRPGQFDEEKSAYALEALDILLDHEFKALLFPFLGQKEPQQRLSETKKQFPHMLLGREQRLHALLAADAQESERWTRICAIYALGLLEDKKAEEAIRQTAIRFAADPVLVETALYSLTQLDNSLKGITVTYPELTEVVKYWQAHEDPQSMILLQKVETLKQVRLFANLPNQELEAVASLMNVVPVKAEETVIREGEMGNRMFVVVDGKMRVHTGERTIATLAAGDVTGEMSLFDAQPRSASVMGTAETSRLLQLDQEPFFQLLAGNPHMARELLVLLSQRLRERTADLSPVIGPKAPQTLLPVVSAQAGIRRGAAMQSERMDLDRFIILKSIEFFSRLDDDLVGQIAVLLKDVDLAGGELLFQQGDPGYSLYIVALGQVRIHVEVRTLAYAGEGEVIGEMALLDAEPRSASVTAVVPSQLLRLDQQPFFELLEVQPQLARGMIKMLSGRLRIRLQELAEQPG